MKIPRTVIALVLMTLQGLIVSSNATVAASPSRPKWKASLPMRRNKKNRVKNVSSGSEDIDDPDLFMEEYEYDTYDDEEYGEDLYEQEKGSDAERKYERSGDPDGEDSYRKNDEWWKDPLAQFEDDEEDELLIESDKLVEDEDEDEEQVPIAISEESEEQQQQQQKSEEEQKTKQPLSETAETATLNEEENLNSESKVRLQQKEEKEKTFNNFRSEKNKPEDSKQSTRNSTGSYSSSSSTLTLQKQKKTSSSSVPSILSSAPAVPALLLQKILGNISPHATATQLILSLAVGNIALFFFQKINKRNDDNDNNAQSKHGVSDLDDDENIHYADDGNYAKEETEEYLDEEELERLEELGFGRTINHINRSPVAPATISDNETEEQYENDNNFEADDNILVETSNDKKKNGRDFNWGLNSILKFGQGLKGKVDEEEQQFVLTSTKDSAKEIEAVEDLGKNKQKRQRRRKPSVSQLQSELEFMAERVHRAEQERDLLEKENDSSHQKLASLQRELQSITQSYDYLQQQTREENKTIESAVRAERQRASEELKRVRSAMVTVLEQERRLMRDQIKQTSAQVRSMMNDYQSDIVYEFSSDFDEKE